MPQIDPKFTFWFGVWTKLLVFIAGYSVDHAPALIQQYAPPVQWVLGMFAQGNDIVLIGLIGLSSNKVGPLVSQAATVIKVLIAALLLSAFLPVDQANAQTQRRLTGNIVNDLANSTASKSSSTLESIGAALAKPFNDIADFIGDDANGAVALATVIPNLQDGHGQQCWIAMQSFGAVIHAHPVPITFHVLQDYETLRLLGMATNNLCANTHCTQVFADLTSMAQAASPMPLAIPSLHDLCTKVPQIAVVAPVTIPADTGASK